MRIDFYIHHEPHEHHHAQPDLAEVIRLLHIVINKEVEMAGELAALQAAVAAEDTVIDSAIVLLQGIKAALDAAIASNDPAALSALSADIGTKTQALSDAIVANTPATP